MFLTSEFKSPEQISDALVTLSALPNSRWQNLLSLDVIKVCVYTDDRDSLMYMLDADVTNV